VLEATEVNARVVCVRKEYTDAMAGDTVVDDVPSVAERTLVVPVDAVIKTVDGKVMATELPVDVASVTIAVEVGELEGIGK
jgi:hypothetical protein